MPVEYVNINQYLEALSKPTTDSLHINFIDSLTVFL